MLIPDLPCLTYKIIIPSSRNNTSDIGHKKYDIRHIDKSDRQGIIKVSNKISDIKQVAEEWDKSQEEGK